MKSDTPETDEKWSATLEWCSQRNESHDPHHAALANLCEKLERERNVLSDAISERDQLKAMIAEIIEAECCTPDYIPEWEAKARRLCGLVDSVNPAIFVRGDAEYCAQCGGYIRLICDGFGHRECPDCGEERTYYDGWNCPTEGCDSLQNGDGSVTPIPAGRIEQLEAAIRELDRRMRGNVDYEHSWVNHPKVPARSPASDIRDLISESDQANVHRDEA